MRVLGKTISKQRKLLHVEKSVDQAAQRRLNKISGCLGRARDSVRAVLWLIVLRPSGVQRTARPTYTGVGARGTPTVDCRTLSPVPLVSLAIFELVRLRFTRQES